MYKKLFNQALKISLVILVICGLIYPAFITGIGQLFFKKQANGSIIKYNGENVGSELIGQNFTDLRFFHGRVSSIKYNTFDIKSDAKNNIPTSGSDNLAPSNQALVERVKKDVEEYSKTYGVSVDKIPEDLITNSGSGLDSDISIESAKIQIPLISKNTGIRIDKLEKIANNNTKGKQFLIFGEKRVNVLKANIEIMKLLKNI